MESCIADFIDLIAALIIWKLVLVWVIDRFIMVDTDFTRFGIGGIGSKFNEIFTNTFESRLHPGLWQYWDHNCVYVVIEAGSVNHTRGILIRGPQGCGKSFLAKQIGWCMLL